MKILYAITACVAINLTICSFANADPILAGDDCDRKTFMNRCDKTVLVSCVNGVVKERDCSKVICDSPETISEFVDPFEHCAAITPRTCVEFINHGPDYPFKANCLSDEDRCYLENQILIRDEISAFKDSIQKTGDHY